MGKFKKNFLVWLVIGFILASFYNSFIRINKNVQIQDIAFSEFLKPSANFVAILPKPMMPQLTFFIKLIFTYF